MSDPIIVPLPVYYGTSDTLNGRPVFPKTGLFLSLSPPAVAAAGAFAQARPAAHFRRRTFNLTKTAGMA